jgi:hypothetical protein
MWKISQTMAIVTINGIPVYSALVTDADTGIIRISLVDDPAVESNFVAFAEQRPVQLYAVQDEDKRQVLGVVMRAGFPIYRRDERLGEYYVIYSADTCRQMAEKYLADGRQNAVNLMHEAGSDVDGVQLVQWFIKGDGLQPAGFEDIADGSLFAEFHVTNDDVWADIKAGTYRGFSLEGVFDLEPATDRDEVQEIVDTLGGVFSRIIKNFKSKSMSKLSKFKAALAKALAEFGSVTTDGGVLVWDGDDDLKAGDAVYIEDTDGTRSVAPDKDYRTDDGKIVRVLDGKVSEIVDDAAEVDSDETDDVAEAFGSKGTDKGTLYWEGDEDLKEGDAVYVDGEDGERTAAPDGDYKTEDGKIVVVENGIAVEIKDAEAEVAPQELSKFARIAQAFDESYEDKERRIAEAIRELTAVSFFIVEAGDDFAVAEEYDGDSYRYVRYEITWDEDGNAKASNPVEVKPAFVPVGEDTAKEVEQENSRLQKQVRDLEKRIEKLTREPAARPAHDEAQAAEVKPTGIKSLDRLARIMAAK